MQERLQKIISNVGLASRREAEKMIRSGRVTVDGKIVTELGYKADINTQKITVDASPIKKAEKKVYYLLYKPTGYISTAKDDRKRKTVLDLMPHVKERIYPVGRLDMDTEGIMLLTNDGDLMEHLLHPRFLVKKTYVAKVQGIPTKEHMAMLSQGILLEEGITSPAEAEVLSVNENGTSLVQITIHEGRNRQVRRMFAALGLKVAALKRTHFAGISLKGLKRGESRRLTPEELLRLKRLAGIDKEGARA